MGDVHGLGPLALWQFGQQLFEECLQPGELGRGEQLVMVNQITVLTVEGHVTIDGNLMAGVFVGHSSFPLAPRQSCRAGAQALNRRSFSCSLGSSSTSRLMILSGSLPERSPSAVSIVCLPMS